MSSRFVPASTDEEAIEADDEWHKAQRAVEANFRRKQEEGKQEGGKSLYEVLQQNKAAKQEAFEESIRLKNQFRTLDDDEVEFLDTVLESTRAKEAAVKKETAEQLGVFRQQLDAAEKALLDETDNVQKSNGGAAVLGEQETWVTSGKKRRRPKDKDTLIGTKLRKISSSVEEDSPVTLGRKTLRAKQFGLSETPKEPTETPDTPDRNAKVLSPEPSPIEHKSLPRSVTEKTAPPSTFALGLGGYSSDED